jgi:hypothetical protein
MFALFGILQTFYLGFIIFSFSFIYFVEEELRTSSEFMICFTIFLVYIILMITLILIIYRNTVKALDNGDFERSKRWTIYAAILGMIFGGGIITFLIFILAYLFFDEALAPKYYYPYPPPVYYPPPGYYYPPPQEYEHYRKNKKNDTDK